MLTLIFDINGSKGKFNIYVSPFEGYYDITVSFLFA